jgi:regulator of cell morphogenesis and NO signaling
MTATVEQTIRDIVVGDIRAAPVLERFGIDFCCKGNRTLGEACRDLAVDPTEVLTELTNACNRQAGATSSIAEWEVETLIEHIIRQHHGYVRRALPSITAHLAHLASAHGGKRPELRRIAATFEEVSAEMMQHMAKEEAVLFPYVEQVARSVRRNQTPPRPVFGSVEEPVAMMEREHEHAGLAMARIRELSGGYQPPAGACATYVLTFRELEEFESDLHVHVHLENNILFPKARTLAASAL